MTPMAWLAAGGCVLWVAYSAAKQRHPVLSILSSAGCGLGVLALLGLLAPLTGVQLYLNRFTGFVAAVLGAPGVIALVALQAIL